MKKLSLAGGFLGLALFSCHALADVALQSGTEVEGNWKLEYTKKSITSTEVLKREDSWAFTGGKVLITHIPRDGSYYDQIPVNYLVENGLLKISLLGRSDKFDQFALLEKDANSMTLKGKFGDIYHFLKK
jgi:hypothetical protein